tara:strand:+ start:192 stop:485 length:294 start_codon:yes stop_codon:yes gene_type:complete
MNEDFAIKTIKNILLKGNDVDGKEAENNLRWTLQEYLKEQLILHGVVASVLCVNDDNCVRLTKGNKYEIEAESEDSYTLLDDFGIMNLFNKERFKKP